jgi:hypothetical protein
MVMVILNRVQNYVAESSLSTVFGNPVYGIGKNTRFMASRTALLTNTGEDSSLVARADGFILATIRKALSPSTQSLSYSLLR